MSSIRIDALERERIRGLAQRHVPGGREVGERTKQAFSLGDPIRVKLIAARLFEKELDFAIVKK